VLKVSQLLDHSSVGERKANIRKAFDRHLFRDVGLFICVYPDEYAAPEERLHPFIVEGVFFHAHTRDAPLSKKIENDGLPLSPGLRESFIKRRKSARE